MSMSNNNEIRYCKNCGAKKSQNFKYCLHCGIKFEEVKEQNQIKKTQTQEDVIEQIPVQKYCPKCGMEVIAEDKYCIECGYRKKIIYNQNTQNKNINNNSNQNNSTQNPIWTVLFILSIINIVLFGWIAGFATIITFIVMIVDFSEGIIPFVMSAGYLALSIFATKYFYDKKK